MNYSDLLNQFKDENKYRSLPVDRVHEDIIDLTSNDYLGLASHANELRQEFHSLYGYPAMTSSASRLLSLKQEPYKMLEEFLANSYGKPSLLFNSGYHANVGIIQALNIPGTLWVCDKLIHASMIDGLRVAKAEFKRWRHNDINHLTSILEKEYPHHERIIILAESIYSMDGDMAPLRELISIKKEFPKVMLYIDEAHAVGCFGERGLGKCEEENIIKDIDIIIGTLGKAFASYGAFAIIADDLKNFLINSARSLIFSTAIPPINVAWSHFMFKKVQDMQPERSRLNRISKIFKQEIEDITGINNTSVSPIIPLITGSAEKAIRLSQYLIHNNILALPIRRPTVPPGGERIRFSLNAGLRNDQIDHISNTLREFFIIQNNRKK